MASQIRTVSASVARVEVISALRSIFPLTVFAILAFLFSGYPASGNVGLPCLIIASTGYVLRRAAYHLAGRARLVEIGEQGISVNGALRLRYERVVGVLPLTEDGRSSVRIATQHGGLSIGLSHEDAELATALALAIEAKANLRVRTFFLRRRLWWGAIVALVGLGLSFGVASAKGPIALAVTGFALILLGALLASVGPRMRVRVGRDGAQIGAFGAHVATLRASEGLRVEAEKGRVRLATPRRTVVFHVPGYEAGMVADEIRTALQNDGADARLVVPPLTKGSARSWLEAVRRRAHAGSYRGRVETVEELRAAIADGTRGPAERIYAALRLKALGEGGALLETARDTTILPRLRVSLEAELAGDEQALMNELEALAVEEATRVPGGGAG